MGKNYILPTPDGVVRNEFGKVVEVKTHLGGLILAWKPVKGKIKIVSRTKVSGGHWNEGDSRIAKGHIAGMRKQVKAIFADSQTRMRQAKKSTRKEKRINGKNKGLKKPEQKDFFK